MTYSLLNLKKWADNGFLRQRVLTQYPYTAYTYYMASETLSTKEVAAILNCSIMTVTELVKRGHFPGARKMDPTRRNSPLRIPREEVEAYQEKQLVSPKPEI